MKHLYDFVVVGAGPTGSVAAQRAAEAGLKTLLIEKRHEIGAPVRCAEAVGAEATKQFIHLDPRWIDAHIFHFAIHNSCGDVLILPPSEPTLVVNRKVFDLELAHLAVRAGAQVRTDCAAVGLVVEDDVVCGVRIAYFNKTETLQTRLVVAADGTESQVARWAGLKTVPPMADYYVGIEFLLAGLKGKIHSQICEYYLNHELAPGGYLWVFPKGGDIANVGLVITADKSQDGNALSNLQRFVAKKFPRSSVLAVIAGGIPVTGGLQAMSTCGLVVVGNAAQQADPLVGGGINLGMQGAALAMQVVVPALQSGDTSTHRLQEYDRIWHKRYWRMHTASYKIRKIFAGMSQERMDALVKYAAGLHLENMSLGQILLAILKNDPHLLFEARSLITTGLIRK
jgi:digeranylgeranylglycerophospholipid reductase